MACIRDAWIPTIPNDFTCIKDGPANACSVGVTEETTMKDFVLPVFAMTILLAGLSWLKPERTGTTGRQDGLFTPMMQEAAMMDMASTWRAESFFEDRARR